AGSVNGWGAAFRRRPLTRARSRRAEAGVDAAPLTTTTRTMLFLSRKATCLPEPFCAQPSGYFIDQPAARFRKTRKTWLSGMSPVAAEFASACKAPGDEVCVVPGLPEFAVVVAAGLVARAALVLDLPDPPQPASTRAVPS